MSKNILIISSNKDLRKDLGKLIAMDKKMLNIDADELLDFELLNYKDVSIKQAGQVLKQLEYDYINRVANFKNCIITMSDQLFLSNDNFKLLKSLNKIYLQVPPNAKKVKGVKAEDKHRLEQELLLCDEVNNLLTKLCDITIKAEGNLNKLAQKVSYELQLL